MAGFLSRRRSNAWAATPTSSRADAAATLARFAGGVPRTVGQLAHLALAAAAGDGLEQVDAATVERAWRELVPPWQP